MSRPLCLDLFCGQGGAGMGYYRAGYDVIGVDNRAQPRYPFPFIQADALEFLASARLGEFSLIHASPPCQAYTAMLSHAGRKRHPDLIAVVRTALQEPGVKWVIENVPGSPLRPTVILCGSHFGLRNGEAQLVRHRWFESPWLFGLLPACDHQGCAVSICGGGTSSYFRRKMRRDSNMAEWKQLMEIDWMTRSGMNQAIPPAYTEWVGRQLLSQEGLSR